MAGFCWPSLPRERTLLNVASLLARFRWSLWPFRQQHGILPGGFECRRVVVNGYSQTVAYRPKLVLKILKPAIEFGKQFGAGCVGALLAGEPFIGVH